MKNSTGTADDRAPKCRSSTRMYSSLGYRSTTWVVVFLDDVRVDPATEGVGVGGAAAPSGSPRRASTDGGADEQPTGADTRAAEQESSFHETSSIANNRAAVRRSERSVRAERFAVSRGPTQIRSAKCGRARERARPAERRKPRRTRVRYRTEAGLGRRWSVKAPRYHSTRCAIGLAARIERRRAGTSEAG